MLTPMDTKNLDHYKNLLEIEKKELLKEIATHSKSESFGDDVDSADEKTDEAEEEGNRLAVVQSLKKDVSEIDTALEKIHRGTYGICDRCGKTIEEEVLSAAPESAMCKACKQLP